jgi:hypothetical protein
MQPWIAGQVNREHIADLRSLGRPFGVPLARWMGRRSVTRVQPRGLWRGASSRRRSLSVRF